MNGSPKKCRAERCRCACEPLQIHTVYIVPTYVCSHITDQVRLVHLILSVPVPSHSRRHCDAVTREHAEIHGTELLFAAHGEKAVGAQKELPQVRRATADDARFRINRLTGTIRKQVRPIPARADEKMNECRRQYERFIKDREFGDRAVPRRGENGRSARRAQPWAAAPCDVQPEPRCCRSPPGDFARHTPQSCAISRVFS